MSELKEVSWQDVMVASKRWNNYPRTKGIGITDFLGSQYAFDMDTSNYHAPSDWAKRIALLTGPHWRTIIEAWLAQHGHTTR